MTLDPRDFYRESNGQKCVNHTWQTHLFGGVIKDRTAGIAEIRRKRRGYDVSLTYR